MYGTAITQTCSVVSTILRPVSRQIRARSAAQQHLQNLDSDGNRKVEWGSYGPKVATNVQSGIYVNSTFDSGNMDIIDIIDDGNIKLAIHEDPFCEADDRKHFQWFFFRVANVKAKPLTLTIINAGESSYPEGWNGYNACCSYDRVTWHRVPSEYNPDTGHFVIKHTPAHSSAYFAYFAPYSLDMHMHLIAKAQLSPRADLVMLGETLDGHDLDMLVIGEDAPEKKKVWVIARQHPGETMAEWFAEGMLDRLCDRHDSVARSLLDQAVVYVIPNMNPDGSWRGFLRTNAFGHNLNRCWQNPTLAECPEVYFTLEKMRETGVDMLIDVHGDECIPHSFISYSEGIPGWTEKMQQCKEQFSSFLEVANPDFQTKYGYPVDDPGKADLRLACNSIGQEFNSFAFTLEMPFKDCADFPDETYGWNPDRAKKFGSSFVTAIRQIVPML